MTTEAPKTAVAASAWECGVCTYGNVAARTICEMCGGPGPKKAGADGKRTETTTTTTTAAPAKTAPKVDGPWSCSACSFNNAATSYACDICGTPDPNKPAPPAGEAGGFVPGAPGTGGFDHDDGQDGGEGDVIIGDMDEDDYAQQLGGMMPGGFDPAALAANPEAAAQLQAILGQLAASGQLPAGLGGAGMPALGGGMGAGMGGGMGGYGGGMGGALPWMCTCGRTNPGMVAACPSCGAVPEDDGEGDEYDPNML